MGDRTTVPRYRARPALRETLRKQGRHQGYVARALRLSESHFSRVVSGERPLEEPLAWIVEALLGVDFDVLFELPEGITKIPVSDETGHAEPAGAVS